MISFFYTKIFLIHLYCSMYYILHSFLWVNDIPLYGYITSCLYILQLMGIWIVSSFWLLRVTLSIAVAQWINDLACLCGGADLIPGPVQWVKDLCCCGCGIGCSSGLDLIHGLGTSICHGGGAKREKKKKRITLSWTFMYKFLYEYVFSFLLYS